MTIGDGGVKLIAVPVVGVKVMLVMETLNEKIEGLGGGVSAIRVRLTAAFPFGGQFVVHALNGPLQEVKAKVVRTKTETQRRALKRII